MTISMIRLHLHHSHRQLHIPSIPTIPARLLVATCSSTLGNAHISTTTTTTTTTQRLPRNGIVCCRRCGIHTTATAMGGGGWQDGRPPAPKSIRFSRTGEKYWDEPEDFVKKDEGVGKGNEEGKRNVDGEGREGVGGEEDPLPPPPEGGHGERKQKPQHNPPRRKNPFYFGTDKYRVLRNPNSSPLSSASSKYKPNKPGYELTSVKISPPKTVEEKLKLGGEGEDGGDAFKGPLPEELKNWIKTSLDSFQNQMYQSDVVTEASLDQHDMLVNHPRVKYNSDLWRMLFFFRRRVDGNAGVIEVFRGMKMRGVVVPTNPEDPNTDIIWNLLFDAALKSPNGPFYKELSGYTRWLRIRKGRQWNGIYSKVITHALVHNPQMVAKFNDDLIDQDNFPAEGWPKFFVNVASQALRLPALYKRAALERLRNLYMKIPVVTGIYEQIVPFLGAHSTMTETYKFHKLCLKRGDAPRTSTPADSLFEYRGIAGSMEEIRALIDNLEEKGTEITEQSLCILVRNRELKEDVLLLFLKRLTDGTMQKKPFGDKFWATVLKARDLKVSTMIMFMKELQVEEFGPEPARALIERLEGKENAVELYIEELKNVGVNVSELVMDKAWLEWKEKDLQEQMNLPDVPMGYEARKYYDEKMVDYLRKHDIRHALLVLVDMRAYGVPIKPSTLHFLLRVILRPRKPGHSPQTTPIHFVGKDDLGFAVQVLMGCVRAGMYVPPTFWKELLKRMGMEKRLEDLAKLSAWLVEWYHPVRGGMMVRRFGTHHNINADAKKETRQLGRETGGTEYLKSMPNSLPEGIHEYGYTNQFGDDEKGTGVMSKYPSISPPDSSPPPQKPKIVEPRSRLPFDDEGSPLPELPPTVVPPVDPDYGVPKPVQTTEPSSESPYPVTHPFRYMPPTIRASHKHHPLRQLFPASFIRAIVEWGFFGIHRRPGTLPLPQVDIGPPPAPRSLRITLDPKIRPPAGSGLRGTDAPGVPQGNTDITWGIRLASYLNKAGVHVDKRIVARALLVRLRAIYGNEKPMHLRSALNRKVREVVHARYLHGIEEVADICQQAWAGKSAEEGGSTGGGRRLVDYKLVAQWAKNPGVMHVIRRRIVRGKWEEEGAGRRLTVNEVRRIGRLRKVEDERRLRTAPGSLGYGSEEGDDGDGVGEDGRIRKPHKPYPVYYHQNSLVQTRPRTRGWATNERLPATQRPSRKWVERMKVPQETYDAMRSWASYDPRYFASKEEHERYDTQEGQVEGGGDVVGDVDESVDVRLEQDSPQSEEEMPYYQMDDLQAQEAASGNASGYRARRQQREQQYRQPKGYSRYPNQNQEQNRYQPRPQYQQYQQQECPPQEYSPQGYPPQEYPPQEYPPQEYPPQDYSPQGYSPQEYPPNPQYPSQQQYPPHPQQHHQHQHQQYPSQSQYPPYNPPQQQQQYDQYQQSQYRNPAQGNPYPYHPDYRGGGGGGAGGGRGGAGGMGGGGYTHRNDYADDDGFDDDDYNGGGGGGGGGYGTY